MTPDGGRKRDRVPDSEYVHIAHVYQTLSLSPAVIYCCGPAPDYPTTFISQSVVSQLGYTPTDFYNDPFFWSKLLHPDDSANVLQELSRIEEVDQIAYEYRVRHRDGHYFWLHDQLSSVRDAAGNPSMVVGSWFDVTERKQVEATLVEQVRLAHFGADVRFACAQKRTVKGILDHCVEAMVRHLHAAFARIWTLNQRTNVLELRASAGIYTHLDGPHSRIELGKLKIGLIAQERKPHLTNAVVGDPRINDQQWAKREGMVAFAGYPLVIEDEVLGVMAMFSRKPLTEAALQAMSSVADVIALGIERKRTEQALHRSERLASVGTLAAGIAHEINNPVTAILLAAQNGLASQAKLDGGQRIERCLKSIVADAERCSRITRSVLQFSRTGTTGKCPSDLTDIIHEAIRLTRPYAVQKGAVIELKFEPGLPRATVDPGQMTQVFVNVIQNAVESGGRGNRVLIRAERASDKILIRISDSGCGMTDEQMSRLFDPFYTTREHEGGTGLGLSIVHGIVLSHGGTIDVESQVGGGTTITIELPLELDRPTASVDGPKKV